MLNRYTVKSRIEGSNPSVSAITKPYTPQTNGLVERFNGRVQREVLGITIY